MRKLGAIFVACAAILIAGAIVALALHRIPAAPDNCTFTYDNRNAPGSITVTWDAKTCALLHQRTDGLKRGRG